MVSSHHAGATLPTPTCGTTIFRFRTALPACARWCWESLTPDPEGVPNRKRKKAAHWGRQGYLARCRAVLGEAGNSGRSGLYLLEFHNYPAAQNWIVNGYRTQHAVSDRTGRRPRRQQNRKIIQ